MKVAPTNITRNWHLCFAVFCCILLKWKHNEHTGTCVEIFCLSVPWGCRQALAALVSRCRSAGHNGEELPRGSAREGRTIEPQCRWSRRGHSRPICQTGRAAWATPPSQTFSLRTYNGGQEQVEMRWEFSACYNKTELSILVTDTVRQHPEYITFNVVSVGQLETINLAIHFLEHVSLLHNSTTVHLSWSSEWERENILTSFS